MLGEVRLREHAEQGCLTDLRESNDAGFHESSLQPSALRDRAQTRAERYEQHFRINEEFDVDQMYRRSVNAAEYVSAQLAGCEIDDRQSQDKDTYFQPY